MARTILTVPDISCGHCERTTTNALAPLEGVRGVAVSIPDKRVNVEYDGQTYYFCAPACKKAFEADPRQSLGASGRGASCSCCATEQ
jgi:YHS domain-containing protein